MLGQKAILKEFSTHFWLLSLDALKLWPASTSVGQGWSVYCVLLGWFSIQTPLYSFSFNLCGSFLTVGCSSWMTWKIKCRLPSQLAMSWKLSILNIQVFRYLSLDRWISGCVLASAFWGSSLLKYNHYQEHLVFLALLATSFLLTENSTTHISWLSELPSTKPLPRTDLDFSSSCLVALKHRFCSIPSTISTLQSFVTWLLQPPLFLCPTLLTFIYNTASSLLSQLRTLALSFLSMCHSSLFSLCPFFVHHTDKHLVLARRSLLALFYLLNKQYQDKGRETELSCLHC